MPQKEVPARLAPHIALENSLHWLYTLRQFVPLVKVLQAHDHLAKYDGHIEDLTAAINLLTGRNETAVQIVERVLTEALAQARNDSTPERQGGHDGNSL